MKINDAGIELIKLFENCKLHAYQDIVGIWTIGYGHTGDCAVEGNSIDQSTADALLIEDLEKFEKGVSKLLTCNANENQFSALVCFSFNIGLHALGSSHLLSKLNAGDVAGALKEFLRWDRAGGKEVPGLLRRRQAEQTLFLS